MVWVNLCLIMREDREKEPRERGRTGERRAEKGEKGRERRKVPPCPPLHEAKVLKCHQNSLVFNCSFDVHVIT